jgi:predicted small secreted protein
MIADSRGFQCLLKLDANDWMYGERNGGNAPPRFAKGIERRIARERKFMKTLFKAVVPSVVAALLLSGSALMVGCNTAKEGAHGAGKDIKNAGEGIKDAGEKIKDKTE